MLNTTNWLMLIVASCGFLAGLVSVIITCKHLIECREEQHKQAQETEKLKGNTDLLLKRESEHHERIRELEKKVVSSTKPKTSAKPKVTIVKGEKK